MNKSTASATRNQSLATFLLWPLIFIYAAARVLQVFPGRVPMLLIVALHVFPPAIFALVHGAMRYSARGILAFLAVCLIVGNLVENAGVLTGFPFGHYYFTSVMGPKFLVVPILLGLAYVGMAYLSWTLARLILQGATGAIGPLSNLSVVTVPLAAGFIMVAWDVAMDPIWSTLAHAWIWVGGGAYFGVPVGNFIGWYLNIYIIYQAFALYLRKRGGPAVGALPLPSGYWHMAVAFYLTSAAGNVLLAIPQRGPSMVADPSGILWRVSSITSACALVSIFTMGAFTLMAWSRLAGERYE